jgi:mono/diheme cytochrome c family protein
VFPPVSGRIERVTGLALTAALVALAASGCGREKEPDLANGKALFVQKCGSCHVLSRAGTKGQIGPNLDNAFAESRKNGLGPNTFVGIVHGQIAHPRNISAMPAGLVTGQDARDVAEYVGKVAAAGGKDQGALASAGAPKVSNKPIVAKAGKLQINADPTGALAFASKRAAAGAGKIEIAMLNDAPIDHDIAVEDSAGKELGKGATVGKGATSSFSTDLKPGTYTFLCTVPGHAAGGMKGTLVVK